MRIHCTCIELNRKKTFLTHVETSLSRKSPGLNRINSYLSSNYWDKHSSYLSYRRQYQVLKVAWQSQAQSLHTQAMLQSKSKFSRDYWGKSKQLLQLSAQTPQDTVSATHRNYTTI